MQIFLDRFAHEALLDGIATPHVTHRDGTLLGSLFESLMTLSVRVYAQASRARVSHLRTRGGEHEVDLIVERRDSRVVALEVKLTATVDDDDVRHLDFGRGGTTAASGKDRNQSKELPRPAKSWPKAFGILVATGAGFLSCVDQLLLLSNENHGPLASTGRPDEQHHRFVHQPMAM